MVMLKYIRHSLRWVPQLRLHREHYRLRNLGWPRGSRRYWQPQTNGLTWPTLNASLQLQHAESGRWATVPSNGSHEKDVRRTKIRSSHPSLLDPIHQYHSQPQPPPRRDRNRVHQHNLPRQNKRASTKSIHEYANQPLMESLQVWDPHRRHTESSNSCFTK